MSETVLWSLAGIGGVAALLIILAAVAGLIALWHNARLVKYDAGYKAGTERVRYQQVCDAAWFSEDVATYHAMLQLGQGLPVADVRDEWRKKRLPAEAR